MTETTKKMEDRTDKLGRIWWLTDTPLFIDAELTSRLHDAIIAPEFENEEIERSRLERVQKLLEGGIDLKATAKMSAPGFLDALFPSLNMEARVDAKVKIDRENSKVDIVKGRRVRTSERLLQEIAFEYLDRYPNRVLFVDMETGEYSNMKGSIEADAVDTLLNSPPRPLVFVELPKKSVIFPTVVELHAGGFQKVFEKLERSFLGDPAEVSYPSDTDGEAPRKRMEYWAALKKSFRSREAMEVLENALDQNRIGWVDFRLLFNKAEGETAHLHVVPAGNYHAGVFGYNFVHRGYRYGSRIVGTLKAGNDINVLAIYDV